MQTSKKIIISAISIICIVCLISVIIIVPYLKSESTYYLDSKARKNLSGSIDYIVIGASHGLSAFKPTVLDEELGVNSYNLSGTLLPMYCRTYLVNKELERNPVKTVVIELSYNSLSRNEGEEYGDGETVTKARLDSFGEQLSFLFKYVKVDDWLNAYSRDLANGIMFYKDKFLGTSRGIDYSAKGHLKKETVDNTLDFELINSTYNSSTAIDEPKEEILNELYKLIDLCKEKNCRVILTVTPLTDSFLWQNKDWDKFRIQTENIAKEKNLELYDFNLFKNRFGLFNDNESFNDNLHMSDDGASVFSKVFSETIKKVDSSEDVSGLFYKTYDEMKQQSPYMNLYLSN